MDNTDSAPQEEEELDKGHEDEPPNIQADQAKTATAMSSSSRLIDRDWDDVLTEIQFHKEYHPQDQVPLDYLEWVKVQRALFQENKLDDDKLEKLSNLGFRWNDDDYDYDDIKFEGLETYQQLLHNSNDDEEIDADDELELAEWFDSQVFLFHNGEMPTEYQQIFEKLGFQLANCTPAKESTQGDQDGVDYLQLIIDKLRTASTDAFQSLQNQEQQPEPLNEETSTTKCDSPGRNTRSAIKRAVLTSGHESSSSSFSSIRPAPKKSPKRQQNTNRKWDESFEALKQYKQANGNCNIPRSYSDKALASWVKTQRKKRSTMSDDRRQKLDELGFLWEPMTYKWNRNFQLLQDYRNKVGGSSMTPEQFARLLGPKTNIGGWFRFQQEQVKTHGKLTTDQQIKFMSFLEGLSKGTPITNKRIADAMSTMPNEKNDGDNGETQQQEMINPAKRVKLARNVLASPDKRNDSKRSWDESLAALAAFKQANGHTNVPQNYVEDTALGHWVKTQRKIRASLSMERQQLLTQLGFNWEPRSSQWMAHFQEVVELGEGLDTRNMDAIEYSKCLCNSLGKWFRSQLVKLSTGQLNDEQQSELIPFLSQFKDDDNTELGVAAAAEQVPPKKKNNWTPTPQRSWEKSLEALKQFKEEHGHTNVPQLYRKDPTLGQWVKTQRKQRLVMKLEKKKALDALSFVWDSRMKKWNDKFQAIREKRKALLGCSTTPERFSRLLGRQTSLGWWFKYQLEQMKLGKLNDDQEAKLQFFLSNLSVGTRTVGLGAEYLNFERGVAAASEEQYDEEDYDDEDDIDADEEEKIESDSTTPALGEASTEASSKTSAAASNKQPVDDENENEFMATLEDDEELRKLQHECETVVE